MCSSNQNTELYITKNPHTIEMYNKFKNEFKYNHYLIKDNNGFIKNFVNPLLKNRLFIDESKVYHRARINNSIPYKKFSNNDLKAPPSELVNDGRFNPKGIPFLYMASNELTAIREVRPVLDDKVGIAQCRSVKSLEIIDLYKGSHNSNANDFRKMLSNLFSLPVNKNEKTLHYRPTQYIAEYFRSKGFDGVRYQSAMDPEAQNICIFNPDDIKITYIKDIKVITEDVELNVEGI